MTSGSPLALSWALGKPGPRAPPSICCLTEGSGSSGRPQRQTKERGRSVQMHPPTMGSFVPGRSHLKGQCPGRICAEYSHAWLSVAGSTGWKPWEPLPPRFSSSTPAIPKVPCPFLMGRAAQSTREQASEITSLVLGKVSGENVCSGETQCWHQSLLSSTQPCLQELWPEACGSSLKISIR